jgi:Uma2 family endonuclease
LRKVLAGDERANSQNDYIRRLARAEDPARYHESIEEMLARTQIGVEEYLALALPDRPEPDYVHGEVVERALPTPIHSHIQAALILAIAPLSRRAKLELLPELRVRIEPEVFRVVDLAIYRDRRPEGRYATEPAFIAIEIVSPDDNYNNLTQRLEDYRRWGVPHVWLVDPWLKRLYEYTEAGLLLQLHTARIRVRPVRR